MNESRSTSLILMLIIVSAACARVFEFVPNFVPIAALAVFGAFRLRSNLLAYLLPLAAMMIGDVLLALRHSDWGYAFHSTQLVVYVAFCLMVFVSRLVSKRESFVTITLSIVGGSALFFLLSNLAVWAFDGMYPYSLSGLVQCYTMAIPFFRNSLLADLSYGLVMFGTFELAKRLQVRTARI